MKRYAAEAERVYAAPRELVWAVVADTNRSDRAMGLAPAKYRWEVDEEGNRTRVASARELGQELEWIEPPYRWIEGRFVQGRRTFVKGPVSRAGFEAHLEDAEGGGTRLRATTWMEAGGVLGFFAGPVQKLKFRSGLKRYFDAIGGVLEGWERYELGELDEPAAIRVKRLLGQTYDEVTSGPRTEPNRTLLERRAARLREARVAPEVVAKLVAHLGERPDEEVQQMRPFELARAWGLDRREVLRAFLHATVAGLCDLRWQINCPVCRVGASIVSGLDSVGEATHCQACQIDFDTDFAQHVEAVFPSNEAVRPVESALYCASSPAFLPHVMAQLEVEPGDTFEEPFELPAGELHVRILGVKGGEHVDVDAPPEALTVTAGEGLAVALDGDAGDGSTTLRITNEGAETAVILLERAGWSADAVLGSVVSSFPEFLDLFATEAPASGVDLRVGHLALLFSDLVGSTALYQRVGDARAFAIVEDHFRAMGDAIAAHQGAIIKTMGDAVMASFASLEDAVAAARAMIEAHDAEHEDDGLGVKIGVYAGPCLAVRANDRLDFFGTTVNLAARLQAQAGASEIVMTETQLSHPEVAALLDGYGRRSFEAALKGIDEIQALVGVRVQLSADEPTSG